VVGGLLGRWYSGEPTWQRAARIALGAWVVFGLGVYPVLGAGLFGQFLQVGPIWHGLTLLIVFGVYGVALWHAYAALAHRASPARPDVSRRVFVRNAAVALAATVGAGTVWRVFVAGEQGSTSAPLLASGAAPATATPPNAPPFDLMGIAPEITAVSDFYTVSKNFIDPAVAVGGWRLKIEGLVDQPMELTYDVHQQRDWRRVVGQCLLARSEAQVPPRASRGTH
jgi:hypothetical protein